MPQCKPSVSEVWADNLPALCFFLQVCYLHSHWNDSAKVYSSFSSNSSFQAPGTSIPDISTSVQGCPLLSSHQAFWYLVSVSSVLSEVIHCRNCSVFPSLISSLCSFLFSIFGVQNFFLSFLSVFSYFFFLIYIKRRLYVSLYFFFSEQTIWVLLLLVISVWVRCFYVFSVFFKELKKHTQ